MNVLYELVNCFDRSVCSERVDEYRLRGAWGHVLNEAI